MKPRFSRWPHCVVLIVAALFATLGAAAAAAADPWFTSTSTIQIGPGRSTAGPGGTATTGPTGSAAAATDTCTVAPAVFRDNSSQVGGHGSVYGCTESTTVAKATITLWEKNASGSEIDLAKKSWSPGAKAPYTTPSIYAKCTSGLNVHTEFQGTLTASAGSVGFTRNTGFIVCN